MNMMGAIRVNADIDHVWRVFSDVEHWPDWTASVTSIQPLDGVALQPGARFRIKQPRLPAVTWDVTAVDGGNSWTWVVRSAGVHTAAHHRLAAMPDGTTAVEQEIEPGGVLGRLAAMMTRGLTRRYLTMEAEGLKARCESALRA